MENKHSPELHKPAFEYEILRDEVQRELLLEKVNELTDNIYRGGYSNVVFLDKSARPLSVLCRDLWKMKYRGDFPDVNFINIGREVTDRVNQQYSDNPMGAYERDRADAAEKARHKEFIEKISANKIAGAVGDEEVERVRREYKYLAKADAGTKVLLVEELSISGESMVLAQKILAKTFPDLVFEPYTVAKAGKGRKTLFYDEATLFDSAFNPPWRRPLDSFYYGVVGVVDDEERPLTAKPAREQPLDARLEAMHDKIVQTYNALKKVIILEIS